MKVRNGFVSNSSSTSFSIYGIGLENEELLKFYNKQHGITEESNVDEDDYVDWYEKLASLDMPGLDLTTCDGYSYIGVSFEDLGDDETGAQFKTRVNNLLVAVFGQEIAGTAEHHYGEVSIG